MYVLLVCAVVFLVISVVGLVGVLTVACVVSVIVVAVLVGGCVLFVAVWFWVCVIRGVGCGVSFRVDRDVSVCVFFRVYDDAFASIVMMWWGDVRGGM